MSEQILAADQRATLGRRVAVANHSFETDDDGTPGPPTGWVNADDGGAATAETSDTRAVQGTKSYYHLETTTAAKGIQQTRTVQSGFDYFVRVWVYCTAGTAALRVYGDVVAAGTTDSGGVTNQWVLLTTRVTTTGTTLSVRLHGKATAWFDMVQVFQEIAHVTNIDISPARESIEVTTHDQAGALPILNAGFEGATEISGGYTEKPISWTINGSPVSAERSDTYAKHGTKSAYIQGRTVVSGGENDGLNQQITMEPNTTYRVSCWARCSAVDGTATEKQRLRLRYEAPVGTYITESTPFTANSTWTLYEFYHTTGSATIVAGSGTISIYGVGTAYVDSVRVQKHNEFRAYSRGSIDAESITVDGFFAGRDETSIEELINDLLATSTTAVNTYVLTLLDTDDNVTTVTGSAFFSNLSVSGNPSELATFSATIRWAGNPEVA